MPDNKNGREKQAQDADNRQRQRDVTAQLERGDETEPPIEADELADFEGDLAELPFPATGADIVDAVGDRRVEAIEATYRVAELVPETDVETFESPAAVRRRVQRPTIAGAMKGILEAADALQGAQLRNSQREAYEKTLRALKAVDAVDDDEGVQVVADWITERIREKGKLPGSRDVRRRAAEFCRKNGYEIRNDEWLGV